MIIRQQRSRAHRFRCAHARVALGVLLATPIASLTADAEQAIVIDWSTRTLVSAPAELGRVQSARLRVRNVNDILYDYQVDITETRRATDDFANLRQAFGDARAAMPGPPTSDPCKVADARTALKDTLDYIAQEPALTPKIADGRVRSVPVASTIATWTTAAVPRVVAVKDRADEIVRNIAKCGDASAAQAFLTDYGTFATAVRAFETRVGGPHAIEMPVTLRPDYDYGIVVTELYMSIPTTGGSKAFTVSPASTVLTLSAGALATALEGRTYAARNAPGATATDPVRPVLAVDGTGWRPLGAALLNYEIPCGSNDTWGLAASTGPVVQFGNTSGTASLGYFFGLSVHMWHRFYITPGFHLGEFADLPIGFTGKGDTVPANFGELVPSKRWSTRFAIAFTYRTLDLSKVVTKPKVVDTTPPAKPAAEDKPKKDGDLLRN